jgi:hypothetical protein
MKNHMRMRLAPITMRTDPQERTNLENNFFSAMIISTSAKTFCQKPFGQFDKLLDFIFTAQNFHSLTYAHSFHSGQKCNFFATFLKFYKIVVFFHSIYNNI